MSISPSHDDKYLEENEPVELEEGWIADGGNYSEVPHNSAGIKGEQRRKLTSRRTIEEYWEMRRLRSQLEDVYMDDKD